MLRPVLKSLCLSILACLAVQFGANDAQAQSRGYVYVANSYYQSPPVYFYDGYYIPPGAALLPARPAPIAPVVGYYEPLPLSSAYGASVYRAPVVVAPVNVAPVPVAPMAVAPVYGRVRETWGGGPYAGHYRYHVDVTGGPSYTYRARNVGGGRVIVHERFR